MILLMMKENNECASLSKSSFKYCNSRVFQWILYKLKKSSRNKSANVCRSCVLHTEVIFCF